MSNIDVSFQLEGLIPFEKYDYVVEGLGGNWPCIITPISGTIRPYGSNVTLDAIVSFCSTKNSCPSGTEGLLPFNNALANPHPNLYTTIRLSLKPETFDYTLYSDSRIIRCDNCFDQPLIDTVSNITLSDITGNQSGITINIVGLQPNTEYTYQIDSVEANWPIKITPSSGTIEVSKDRIALSHNIMFCASTGICESGTKNVMNYNSDPKCSTYNELYGIVHLTLNSSELGIEPIVSDPILIECNNCIEQIQVSDLIDTIVINNDNRYNLESFVTGLKANHTYNYVFDSLSANWPVYVNNQSGTFTAKSTTHTINADMIFCASTGICQALGKNVLPYILDENCIFYNSPQFVELQITIESVTCDQETATNTTRITCDDCLPKTSITAVEEVILSTPNNHLYNLTHSLSGLIENQRYNYLYQGVDSNWPTIISPVSGSFLARSGTYDIESDLMFCYPQNLCPSGTEGLFDYTLDSRAQKILNQNVLSTSLNLTIIPNNCGLLPVTSDTFTLHCSGCLPAFSYSSINFTDTPELSLAGPCCTGMKTISVDVSGTVPGDKYTYVFDSASTDVSFTPSSGTVYFGGDGAGSVNTVMNVNLVDSQQIVISCELTHYNSDIKTMDFLAVRCSGACAT